MEFNSRSITRRELEDVLRSWQKHDPSPQPATAELIRSKLGLVATTMDADLESAMNDLVQWWQDNRAVRASLPSARQ